MIDVDTARQLQQAGLRWTPASGDRFIVDNRGMNDEIFVLSEMTVEVQELPQGTVIGFNGTTEWALDSVEQRDAVWLPREGQLRELLAGTFRSLTAEQLGFRVDFVVNGRARTATDPDAEQAYALALLYLLTE